MYVRAIGLLSILLFPAFLSAASAGFPERSMWLSNDSPKHGEAVTLYTVVYNSTRAPIDAKLSFLLDGAVIGSQDVALAAGETKIASAVWTADAGEHTFSARFEGGGIAQQDTPSIAVTVTDPPPPTAAQQAVATFSDIASTSLPIVSSIGQKIYATTESWREAGLAFAQEKIADAEVADKQVLGTSTRNVDGVTGFEQTETPGLTDRIAQAAAPMLAFVFASQAYFYVALLILIFVVLYLLTRWATRPRF